MISTRGVWGGFAPSHPSFLRCLTNSQKLLASGTGRIDTALPIRVCRISNLCYYTHQLDIDSVCVCVHTCVCVHACVCYAKWCCLDSSPLGVGYWVSDCWLVSDAANEAFLLQYKRETQMTETWRRGRYSTGTLLCTSTNTQYYDPVFTYLVLPPVLLDTVEEEVFLGSNFLSVV